MQKVSAVLPDESRSGGLGVRVKVRPPSAAVNPLWGILGSAFGLTLFGCGFGA